MESILTSVKKDLGIPEEDENCDPDIIRAINTARAIRTQIGIGPAAGFSIQDKTAVWTDFVPDTPYYEPVKNDVVMRVKLIFDPPTSGPLLDSTKNLMNELEWRLNVAVDHD